MSAQERIRRFVTTNFYVPDPSVLSDSASFLDAGIVDSTGVLEIVNFLETEFEVKVEDDDVLVDLS